jgi:DNA primase large subunit
VSKGCPFRHYNESKLRASLSKLSVKESDISSILEDVKGQNFQVLHFLVHSTFCEVANRLLGILQVACRRHFEVTHKNANAESVGNHPNAWFDASRAFYADSTAKTESPAAKAKVEAFNSPSAPAAMVE